MIVEYFKKCLVSIPQFMSTILPNRNKSTENPREMKTHHSATQKLARTKNKNCLIFLIAVFFVAPPSFPIICLSMYRVFREKLIVTFARRRNIQLFSHATFPNFSFYFQRELKILNSKI